MPPKTRSQPLDVLVAVPTRGAVSWQTVARLCELRDRNRSLAPILWQPGNLSVALTRNRIVKALLSGPWQTLVMVDDDVVPPVDMLDAIVPPVASGEYAMVGVPHPFPAPWDPSSLILGARVSTPDGFRDADLNSGLNEVDGVSTGCVAVSRAALVALGPNPFRITNDPDALPASDDYLFCDDLRAAGFRIAAAVQPGWFCDHVSSVNLSPLLESQQRRLAERST